MLHSKLRRSIAAKGQELVVQDAAAASTISSNRETRRQKGIDMEERAGRTEDFMTHGV